MQLARAPIPALRPFVQLVWLSDEPAPAHARERVIPTGCMHLVIRLDDEPVRIFANEHAAAADTIASATLAGARAAYYVKDTTRPVRCVGAVLEPAASLPLVGIPAGELAGRHTPLAELWGSDVAAIRDHLLEVESPHDRLARFEAALARRLPRVRGVHPAVAHALAALAGGSAVAAIVDETGYSHRWLATAFRAAVGLAPKAYARVLRVQRVLRAHRATRAPWSALALAAGYSDQAHLTRELRELAGVTPAELARLAPIHANHVPIPARSISFKTRASRAAKLAP